MDSHREHTAKQVDFMTVNMLVTQAIKRLERIEKLISPENLELNPYDIGAARSWVENALGHLDVLKIKTN